jgi:hypothetical protein
MLRSTKEERQETQNEQEIANDHRDEQRRMHGLTPS